MADMTMRGNSDVLNHAFTLTSQYLGELETQLRRLDGVRMGLEAAVQQSKTSSTMQVKLHDALASGNNMARYLQSLADALKQRGAKIDADDLDGSSALGKGSAYAAEGADGQLNTTASVSKVDNSTWV